ncbi:MAG: tryptophan--tRNA ligase [bacterium]|nr:tryptophan--tRNA ligase [bacterium]
MKRILSGITPSSTKGLHIGNYLGMVKPAVGLQSEGECYYFVANLHALNTVYEPKDVMHNTFNIFIEYLAFGIDPIKTVFYVESDIPEIPYLQTIINNAVTVAELKRMHAYKDKLQDNVSPDSIGFGMFSYPMLMAADILAFDTEIVPVGEDQAQHVEITRDIARTFNNRYGDILVVPELSVQKSVARVPGIFGDKKMSKSLGNDIPIFGSEEEVKKQIMSIKTDPARIHPSDPGDPKKNIAFTYLDLLNYDSNNEDDSLPKLSEMKERYKKGTIGDVEIKKILYSFFLSYFADSRAKKHELAKDTNAMYELRMQGAEKARATASKVIDRVKKAVGV